MLNFDRLDIRLGTMKFVGDVQIITQYTTVINREEKKDINQGIKKK